MEVYALFIVFVNTLIALLIIFQSTSSFVVRILGDGIWWVEASGSRFVSGFSTAPWFGLTRFYDLKFLFQDTPTLKSGAHVLLSVFQVNGSVCPDCFWKKNDFWIELVGIKCLSCISRILSGLMGWIANGRKFRRMLSYKKITVWFGYDLHQTFSWSHMHVWLLVQLFDSTGPRWAVAIILTWS